MIRCVLAGIILLTMGSIGWPSKAHADTTILMGRCDPLSNFATGSAQSNLDEHSTRFRCDTAVIIFPQPGRILIQFTLKADLRGDIIGFAGEAIEGGLVDVDHLYMNDGRTLDVTKGRCQTWLRSNGSIKSLLCGARVERGDLATAAVIKFDAIPTPRRPKR